MLEFQYIECRLFITGDIPVYLGIPALYAISNAPLPQRPNAPITTMRGWQSGRPWKHKER